MIAHIDGQLEAMRSQLFRYAQDLQELIDQHGILQQRYQAVLQAQGRAGLNNDLLLRSIRAGGTPYLSTNRQGDITHVSLDNAAWLGPDAQSLCGLPLLDLCPHQHRASLNELLTQLASPQRNSALELRQFEFFDGNSTDSTRCFDVLVVPIKAFDQFETLWLLHPHQPDCQDDLSIVLQFDLLQDSNKGMLIADTSGTICSTNAAFSHISGYSASEVVGHNAHMLSSGRHGISFYRTFWNELAQRGSWDGEFFNRRKNGQIYPEWKTVKAIQTAAGAFICFLSVFTDSSHQASDVEHLSHLAYHDALTGLPNRRLLEDRLKQALSNAERENAGLTLFFIDLDAFKPINDTYGHETGDLVLQEIGQRLKRSIRQGDTAARVGGDEFVVLLQKTVDAKDVKAIATTLLTHLHEPIAAAERQFSLDASIGCARYPQDGQDSLTLLKNADSAMYAAKRSIGSNFCFFDEQND